MINAIIRWSIVNRVLVLLVSAVITFAGIYSLMKTPIDAIPDLSDVQVIVKTSYPGQAPQVVEDQVTFPLSTAMLAVPGAVNVRGFSYFGDSYIYIIFEDNTDIYWARSRVLEYLAQVAPSLPEAAKPQLGPDATGVGWVYMYALTDTTGSYDLSELSSIQNWFLKLELQTVPGVSEVATMGGMVKQYQVTVDPDKLRAYNIPLSHIELAIKRANQEVGASVIELAEAEYMVRASGYIQNKKDLALIPLGLSEQGTPLLLQHVASIDVGPQMRRGVTELNGEGEVVGGIVVMRFGENAKHTIEAVRKKLSQLRQGLPEGVDIVTVYDRSELIDAAVQNIWQKLILEFLIVALVCVVFLMHIRSALVAILSLPVGILAAFVVIHIQGINANIMSLGGIAIAVGAMIDGAVVMVENMHRHLDGESEKITTKKRWEIVVASAVEVGPALFFSLLIITVSFLPVFTLEAQEGRMFAPLAFTKSYAMAAAAILSVTLVPVLMGYFVRGKILCEQKNPLSRCLVSIYAPLLRLSLRFPMASISLAVLILALTIWPASKIGSEFMPSLDEGDLMYMPTTSPGISVGKARQILQQTDRLIRTVPEVDTVFGKVGRALTATDPAPLTMIETIIQFKDKSEWRPGMTKQKLRDELDALVSFPGLTNAWVMPIKTRIDMLATGIKTPVGIKVSGTRLSVIQDIGVQLENILSEVSGTGSVYSERVAAGRYINIDIDRGKAAHYGLNIEDIQVVISSAVGGRNITQTYEGLERYPINIRYPQSYRDSPEQLELLPIITASGLHITLADVATVIVASGPAGIKSENARTTGWVFVDVTADQDIGSYVKKAKRIIENQLNLPAGYSISWVGQYEYMQRAMEKLRWVIPFTLSIIAFLLFLNFRRLTEVTMLMATVPFALVGSIWMMYLFKFNFSIASAVGFVALAGVAVEIGVIMLVYLNQGWVKFVVSGEGKHVFDGQGQSVYRQKVCDLVVENAVRRLRPIAMTSATIIIGLLPVLFDDGVGSELVSRIAAPVVGGMISSLVLGLFVIPTMFFVWKCRSQVECQQEKIDGVP